MHDTVARQQSRLTSSPASGYAAPATLPWGFAPRPPADRGGQEHGGGTGRRTPASLGAAAAGDEHDDAGARDPIEVLSHELRSPITTIHLGTKMLRSGRTVKDPVRSAVVEAVEVEVERLHRLVEDLLAVARHEGGREPLPVQPLLLQRAVPPILAAVSAAHEGARLRAFLPADLPPVRADEAALEHVLRNVIGNAVRFSPPGSPIEVVATAEPAAVALQVADRGPGIDPSEAERIFEPFYRSPRTAATPGGAGLGLAAARRLLDAMGGSIAAAPGADGGGVVTVRLAAESPVRA